MSGEADRPLSFIFEVDGVELEFRLTIEAAAKIADWSTSIALLNLGSEAPLLQEGIRKLFAQAREGGGE